MSIAYSATAGAEAPSSEVTLFRLYLLRAVYLVIVVGLGVEVWPKIVEHAPVANLAQGVVRAMLAGLSLMALIGLRYPLKMLPALFFEGTWKAIWLIVIAWPAWMAHAVDADMAESIKACAMGVIVPIAIPWGYVFRHYLKAPGDRWW